MFSSAHASGGRCTAFEDFSLREISFRDWAFSYLKPRYLSLGIVSFVAFYVGFKFLFLVFDATDLLERWVFELTPLSLMGLPELQLVLLAAAVAATNVLLHSSNLRRNRFLGTILTLTMIASLILALRSSPYYFDAVNLPRFAVLATLLASIPLDHMDLLRRRGDRREKEYQPAPEVWGPPEPEAFDEAMDIVDDALLMLDADRGGVQSKEETSEVAAALLEGLLESFEEKPVDPRLRTAVATEATRRQALFRNRIQSIDLRLEADPKDVDALFTRATYLAMQKQHQGALEALDQVTLIDPTYPGVWYFKAKIHQFLGNMRLAELCLSRASESG